MEDERFIHGRTRPKFGSKRWYDLRAIAPAYFKCEQCGAILLNPLSIIMHKGKSCENRAIRNTKSNHENMKIKYRKLSTGNYMGYCGRYYIFIRKREHGKWDGYDRYVFWYTAVIGSGGEWLYSEGVHTSYLTTLAKAKKWVYDKLKQQK